MTIKVPNIPSEGTVNALRSASKRAMHGRNIPPSLPVHELQNFPSPHLQRLALFGIVGMTGVDLGDASLRMIEDFGNCEASTPQTREPRRHGPIHIIRRLPSVPERHMTMRKHPHALLRQVPL